MSEQVKVVVNKCFGGFSLSREAVALLAKKQGRKAYFFEHSFKTDSYAPLKEGTRPVNFFAFDIPNPNDFEEKELWDKHSLETRPKERADKLLVEVVEELGKKANGDYADLGIVLVPADAKWHIEEYDGSEHVAEDHRTWG